jgi:hypothetical protein
MTNRTASTSRPSARAARPEQLNLLPASSQPLQFRLDRATRERGLAHVAAIRRQLAERAAHTSSERAA